MQLTDRDKEVIKLLALIVQMERATDKRFIFQNEFIKFINNLTEEERLVVNTFYEEMQNSDLISAALDQWIKDK